MSNFSCWPRAQKSQGPESSQYWQILGAYSGAAFSFTFSGDGFSPSSRKSNCFIGFSPMILIIIFYGLILHHLKKKIKFSIMQLIIPQ
jgi:hypothetical protein